MPSQVQKATPDEAAILALISEQQAIQVDHLARFFDLYVSDMNRILKEFEFRRWLVVEELILGHSPWVGLCPLGARLSGTGFGVIQPSIRSLPHLRAINEARLLLTRQSPSGKWISERQLRRDWHVVRRRSRNIPDAAFVVDGKRWAIEVELSHKKPDQLRAIIADHSLRYDVVVYLCSRLVARHMDRLGLVNDFSNLAVRELFEPVRSLNRPEFRTPAPRRSDSGTIRLQPEPWEVHLLTLLAEQHTIPVDQFARFLKCDVAAAERIASHFAERGLVNRARPLANELDWIWLTKRGAGFSTTGLSAYVPKVGGLERRRALNEIRLLFAERVPGARWVSERTLRKMVGPEGALPAAVVEVGREHKEERHAIELCLVPSSCTRSSLEERMTWYSSKYHTAAFFCAPRTYEKTKRLVAEHVWSAVVVQLIPGYQEYPHYLAARRGGFRDRFEPADMGVVVERLDEAVRAGRLLPSRARSLAGYLLLRAVGVSQGSVRAQFELVRECKELELLLDPLAPIPLSCPVDLELADALAEHASREVKAGRLQPSRARSLVGYALLSDAGVPQGHIRTVYELKADCKKLLADDSSHDPEVSLPKVSLPILERGGEPLTWEELHVARMAAWEKTNLQIALELDCSASSIQELLDETYVKLGISGPIWTRRKQLAKALAYPDAAAGSSQT